jgi:hypothetical protein
MENAVVEIITGINKTTKKEWKGLKIVIGDWSTLIFTKSKFEMDYIEKYVKDLA